jgi:hypothetical protein
VDSISKEDLEHAAKTVTLHPPEFRETLEKNWAVLVRMDESDSG